MKEKYKKENLEPIILTSKNWTDVLRKLGMSIHGNSRTTLKKYAKRQNISIIHFESREERYLRVNKISGYMKRIPLNEILVSGSTYYTTNHLKERLYDEGLKERKCELCGQDENWNGMKISLILDHINGINNDNRIENLRIVCPNCNAGLPTHGGKNIKNRKQKKKKVKVKKKYYCLCGKEISKNSTSCSDCNNIKRRTKIRPSKETLIQEVKEYGFSATGRKYGVSDNAIRKWIKFYEKVD